MYSQSPTPVKHCKAFEFITMDNIKLVRDLFGEKPKN